MVGCLTCCLKFESLNKTQRLNIFCKIWGWKEQSMKWEREDLKENSNSYSESSSENPFICMQSFPEETVKLHETCCISRYNVLIWSYSTVTRSLSHTQSASYAIISKRIFLGQTLSWFTLCFQTHCEKSVEHVIFFLKFIAEQKSQEE